MINIALLSDRAPSTENLSPALAAMVAVLVTPVQYGKFVSDTVEHLNTQCKGVVRYIGK